MDASGAQSLYLPSVCQTSELVVYTCDGSSRPEGCCAAGPAEYPGPMITPATHDGRPEPRPSRRRSRCLDGLALCLLPLLLAGCTSDVVEQHPSPSGESVLVVEDRIVALSIDPEFVVKVKRGWRTFDIGCVNGDWASISSVRWLDEDTVELGIDWAAYEDEKVTVTLDERGQTTVTAPDQNSDKRPSPALEGC